MKTNWIIAALVAVCTCVAGGWVSAADALNAELLPISTLGDTTNSSEKAEDCGACGSCDIGDKCSCGVGYCEERLLGIVRRTDRRYSDFISPMTNPVFFEDPRNLSELRLIFLQNEIPGEIGGGNAKLVAAQIRASLTERLSLIAAKSGFIWGDHPGIGDGWADLAVGMKYMLFADPCAQRILSAGVSYELPIGSTQALQGNGDGEFHAFLTGGAQIGENWHWLSGSGFRLPVDTVDESQVWYWSNHLDYMLTDRLYVLGELNWYHWMKSGQVGPNGIEGVDLFNLGSTGVAGNDIVTGAVGAKFVPNDSMEIGIAWEAPIENRKDVMDNRFTVDWIIRY